MTPRVQRFGDSGIPRARQVRIIDTATTTLDVADMLVGLGLRRALSTGLNASRSRGHVPDPANRAGGPVGVPERDAAIHGGRRR